ncbi:uncharacterized protein TNCV_4398461 [Trichonephila clavipes]|nr:uncharacterized protein TNCV_4398461 [Trichonephila clavipes]
MEIPPRLFGSSPIGRTCEHYSAIEDNILVTLTSLVKMWTPQQKVNFGQRNVNQSRVESHVFEQNGTGEYFPPLQFTCRNCGGGDRGRVAIYHPFGEVSLKLNRTVTCMVLKANDRRTSCPCHDEFRGPRSDYVRQVALATTTT